MSRVVYSLTMRVNRRMGTKTILFTLKFRTLFWAHCSVSVPVEAERNTKQIKRSKYLFFSVQVNACLFVPQPLIQEPLVFYWSSQNTQFHIIGYGWLTSSFKIPSSLEWPIDGSFLKTLYEVLDHAYLGMLSTGMQ